MLLLVWFKISPFSNYRCICDLRLVSVLDKHCCSGNTGRTLVDVWLYTYWIHTEEKKKDVMKLKKIFRERSRLSFIQNSSQNKREDFFLLGTDPVIKRTISAFLFWGCIKWQSKAVEEVWAWKQSVSFTVSKVQEWNRVRVNSKTEVSFFFSFFIIGAETRTCGAA